MKKITAIFLAAMVLLTSCEKSPIVEDAPQSEREAIELSLGTLMVEQMGAGTAEAEQQSDDKTIPLTKSDLISSEPLTDIKNLWVVQFASDGRIVGDPQYIETYANDTKVKLIPSGGVDNTIVYLANTFKDDLIQLVGSNYTIDDLRKLNHSITDEASNFTTDGATETKYMVMYGSITQPISSGDALEQCTLHRTVAKISVTIENTVSNFTFKNIILAGAPNASYYLPTEGEENFPADGSFASITYATDEIETNESTFTFYVPTNRRGEVSNDSEQMKNHFADYNCTSINLIAQDTEGTVYSYTFYLGANLTNDFNIDCDKEYKYTLTFTDKGDPDTDLRVEKMEDMDFTSKTMSRSNCYILNPSPITELTYYIPIDRIDQFWDSKNGYVAESLYGDNTLNSVGNSWEAVLLWHDSAYTLADDDSQNLGGLKIEKGTSPTTGEDCVVVTLPANYQTCNVGYVVRRTDKNSKDILWSWHLWITDYNPYPKNLKPSLGIWNYSVTGGELHRYDNATFVGGIYSDKFIMDRNIGAHGAGFEGHGSIQDNSATMPGSLYYQFGRKDPFPRITTNKYLNGYTYGNDGSSTTQRSFEYAVNNPNTFVIYGGNWCSDDDSQETKYIWNDHTIDVTSYTTGKSIFDPSPWGFRVPINGTWAGFDSDRDGSAGVDDTTNEYPHFMWATTPYIDKAGRIYREFTYYPASGYRNYSYGGLGNGGSSGYFWTATTNSSTNGYYLNFGSTSVYPSNSTNRSYGFPVRPIQE